MVGMGMKQFPGEFGLEGNVAFINARERRDLAQAFGQVEEPGPLSDREKAEQRHEYGQVVGEIARETLRTRNDILENIVAVREGYKDFFLIRGMPAGGAQPIFGYEGMPTTGVRDSSHVLMREPHSDFLRSERRYYDDEYKRHKLRQSMVAVCAIGGLTTTTDNIYVYSGQGTVGGDEKRKRTDVDVVATDPWHTDAYKTFDYSAKQTHLLPCFTILAGNQMDDVLTRLSVFSSVPDSDDQGSAAWRAVRGDIMFMRKGLYHKRDEFRARNIRSSLDSYRDESDGPSRIGRSIFRWFILDRPAAAVDWANDREALIAKYAAQEVAQQRGR